MVFYSITIFLLFLLLENLPQIHKIWLVCPNKLLLFSTGSYFFSAKKKKINQQMRLFISFSLFSFKIDFIHFGLNDNLKARNKKGIQMIIFWAWTLFIHDWMSNKYRNILGILDACPHSPINNDITVLD